MRSSTRAAVFFRRLTLSLLSSRRCYAFSRRSAVSAADSDQKNQNWPQWRGPLCTGVAPDAHPPTEWSADKNIKWKVELPGAGSSTPIIWGDQIFIHTAIPTGRKLDPPADPPADATADSKSADSKPADAKDASATTPPASTASRWKRTHRGQRYVRHRKAQRVLPIRPFIPRPQIRPGTTGAPLPPKLSRTKGTIPIMAMLPIPPSPTAPAWSPIGVPADCTATTCKVI